MRMVWSSEYVEFNHSYQNACITLKRKVAPHGRKHRSHTKYCGEMMKISTLFNCSKLSIYLLDHNPRTLHTTVPGS